MNDLQRFIKRIGTTIYRENYCFQHIKMCKDCELQKENGFIIMDESHASLLLNAQNEMGYIYQDKIQ